MDLSELCSSTREILQCLWGWPSVRMRDSLNRIQGNDSSMRWIGPHIEDFYRELSYVDKGLYSSRVFPSARVCLLLGRSWGLWVMAHLIPCKPWTYHRATDHYSNFQLPSILKSIQLYCLPSFYLYQTETWLLRLIMELQLLHITNVIPPLYPIVLHPFILLGYSHLLR